MADANGRNPGDAYYDPTTETDPSQSAGSGGAFDPNTAAGGDWFGTNAPPVAPPVTSADTPPVTSASGAPVGGSLTDPAYVNSLITYYSRLPGADPSLSANPSYWFQKILSGELGTDQAYVVDKLQNAWKTPQSMAIPGDLFNAFPGVAPTYTPVRTDYPNFSAPSLNDLLQDPGYQFRLSEGERAMTNSAAGKGELRGGGTLKAFDQYGQDMASQEYGNVFNRDLSTYQANLGTFGANNASTTTNNNALYARFMDQYNQFRARQNDTYNYISGQQQLGAYTAGQ